MTRVDIVKDQKYTEVWRKYFIGSFNTDKNLPTIMIQEHLWNNYNAKLHQLENNEYILFENDEDAVKFMLQWS